MDVRRTAFLLGAATNWFAFAATLAVSFFLTPYLIGTLGTARYDVWCVAESVLAYFSLLDMGVAACLVRYVAKHHASADRDGLNRIASACLGVFLAAGVLSLVLGIPVMWAFAPTLEAKAGHPGDVFGFLLVMLANLAATLPLSVFPSVLDGLERFAAKSAVRVVFLILRGVGIVWAVQSGPGLLPLALVYTAATLAEHAVMALLCFRFLPGLRFSWRLIDRATLKEVKGYSGDAFLAMLAGRVTAQTGAIAVGIFLPAGQVTFFATAMRLVEYAKTLLRTVTATLSPGVSAMEARGEHAAIGKLFVTATRWVLYAVIPVNLGLWFFGKPFLARWVGSDFVDGSFPAVAILASTLSLGIAQSAAARILYGVGQLRLFARLALAEGAANLLLTVTLVQPFGVGGVAVAVAIPNLIFCVVVIAYTRRLLAVPVGVYLREGWSRPVLAGALPMGIWLTIGPADATWPAIATGIAAGLVPYTVLVAGLEVPAQAIRRVLRGFSLVGRAESSRPDGKRHVGPRRLGPTYKTT